MEFLELEKFADLVKSRGFFPFNKDVLKTLWKLGLLRADFVQSKRKLTLKNIVYIGKDEYGRYFYSDCRKIPKRARLVDIPKRDMIVQPGITLVFHPFRYYLVTHLARILDVGIGPLQLITNSKGAHMIIDHTIRRFSKYLDVNPNIFDRLEYWNSIAELAIATEPCVYDKIFHAMRLRGDMPFSKCTAAINKYWRTMKPYYVGMPKSLIDEYRMEVCIEAETLNENKNVNMLLRMMDGSRRLELEGELGGAVYLHTLAEVLRRGYEKATGDELREEDELGFGYMPTALKKTLYGSNRILDDRRAMTFFLQQHGLGYGTSVHWYVEGRTEVGALKRVFQDSNAITIINLEGRVVEKKTVSFLESLKQDIAAGMFSMVSVDGDRKDNTRAVKGAAKDDSICGMFFIAEPDFEFHNFSKSELVDVLASYAEEKGSGPIDRKRAKDRARDCVNCEQLFSLFRKECHIPGGVHKGEEWGALLCEFALKHPYVRGTRRLRPFIEAIQIASRSVGLNYNNTRRRMRVDTETGRLVERSKE